MKRRRTSATIPAPPPIGSSLRISLLRLIRAIGPRPEHQTPEAGVRYTPVGSGSLLRALSARGPGHKHYLARFPDGETLRITATRRREFADLTPPSLLLAAREAAEIVPPGARAVVLNSGTGWLADLIAQAVGPAGGVIGLEPEAASIAYASLRYHRPQLGFEQGDIASLKAETDASFDAAVIASPAPEDPFTLPELARLVRPDGLILIVIAAQDARRVQEKLQKMLQSPRSRTSSDQQPAIASQAIGSAALIVARPGPYRASEDSTEIT